MSEFLLPPDDPADAMTSRERATQLQTLEDHPIAATLDEEARAALLTRGRFRSYAAGALLPDDEPMVRFVLAGALGSFATVDFLCLSYFAPGSVSGLESVLGRAGDQVLQAVVDVEVFEVTSKALTGAIGRREAERLLAISAVERLIEAEAAMTCLATHGVGPRLARWLMRLHALNPNGCIAMSQERLSQLLGVQRTSVNAAAHPLQAQTIIRYRRGRISVLDFEGLKAAACRCAGAAVGP